MTNSVGMAVLVKGIMTTEHDEFHTRLRQFIDRIIACLSNAGVAMVPMPANATIEGVALPYAVFPYPAGAMYIDILDLADETGVVAPRRVLTTQLVVFLAEPDERAREVAAVLDQGMVGLQEEFPHTEWQFTDPASIRADDDETASV